MNDLIATAISTRPIPREGRNFEWGPNNMFAVASEHFVTIYQYKSSGIKIIRTISRHKSNIISVKWNVPTTEITHPDAFQTYLAVVDETGNILIYDVFTGRRHAGISPDTGTSIGVLDIAWSPFSPTQLYALTTKSLLMCFSIGSPSKRRQSFVEDATEYGYSIKSFNMTIRCVQQLNNFYHLMSIDPFSIQILLMHENGTYAFARQSADGSFNGVTQPQKLTNIKKVTNVEFFPHATGRILVIADGSLWLVDITNGDATQLIQNSLASTSRMFSPSDPKSFWAATQPGQIIRFSLDEKAKMFVQKYCISGGRPLLTLVSNPHDPSISGALFKNGRINIFKDTGRFLCTVGEIPSMQETISAWCATKDGFIAIATNLGIVLVIHGGKTLRFEVKDRSIFHVSVIGRRIVLCGEKVHFIDLESRTIESPYRYVNPKLFAVCGDVIAVGSMKNVVDFINVETNTKTPAIFKDTVSLLFAHESDPTRWCVFVNNAAVLVLSLSTARDRSIRQSRFPLSEAFGDINDAVFFGDTIIAVSSKGNIYKVNTSTKTCATVNYNQCVLKKVRRFGESVAVVDSDGGCATVDIKRMHTITPVKWKLLDVQPFGDGFSIIQTSSSSLRVVSVPGFDTFTMEASRENDHRERFLSATTPDQMVSVASEIGDLDFLQFVAAVRRSYSQPLPAVSTAPRALYTDRDLSLRVLEMVNPRLAVGYVEHLILTGRLSEAADVLLKDFDSPESALLAYCCLAPSADAARAVSAGGARDRNGGLKGRLLAIAGERRAAVDQMEAVGDFNVAMKYSKILEDDEESSRRIEGWSGPQSNPRLRAALVAFEGEDDRAVSLLWETRQVSKAVFYIRERRLEDKDDENVKEALEVWMSSTPILDSM